MIKHCLFPVAGFGTRFLPVTKIVPKELLPILEKPLIQYAIDEAYESGMSEMVVVLNEHKLAIKKYFEPFPYLESLISSTSKIEKLNCIYDITENCTLDFINQTEMLGLGHAILQAKDIVRNNSFAVILPDDLCYCEENSVLSQMMEISKENKDKCILAVEEVNIKDVEKYGVVSIKSSSNSVFQVDEMIEKPSPSEAPSNLAIVGRYILTPDIFEILERTEPDQNGEIQVTNALRELVKFGKVIAYKFEGKRIDCGSVEGYIDANNFFSSLNSGL